MVWFSHVPCHMSLLSHLRIIAKRIPIEGNFQGEFNSTKITKKKPLKWRSQAESTWISFTSDGNCRNASKRSCSTKTLVSRYVYCELVHCFCPSHYYGIRVNAVILKRKKTRNFSFSKPSRSFLRNNLIGFSRIVSDSNIPHSLFRRLWIVGFRYAIIAILMAPTARLIEEEKVW